MFDVVAVLATSEEQLSASIDCWNFSKSRAENLCFSRGEVRLVTRRSKSFEDSLARSSCLTYAEMPRASSRSSLIVSGMIEAKDPQPGAEIGTYPGARGSGLVSSLVSGSGLVSGIGLVSLVMIEYQKMRFE